MKFIQAVTTYHLDHARAALTCKQRRKRTPCGWTPRAFSFVLASQGKSRDFPSVARDEASTADRAAASEVTVEAPPPRRGFAGAMRAWRWPLMIGGPLILIAVAAWFVLTGGKTEGTDDSYVQAARVPISASIGGRVTELDVQENQVVHKGDVLFRLDTKDLSTAVDQAQAQLNSARLQVQALGASYQQTQTMVRTAQDTAAFDAKEVIRQQALFNAGVASRDQVETAQHNADLARQQIATAQQAAAKALADLGGAQANVAGQPIVQQAQAALDRAQLNQSYGAIVAPQDGVVTRVEQLQVGTYINPAQTLFWLVAGQPWIEANFKEDQLAKMRIGQPAKIHIDACPNQDFDGHVASFSPGAGQAFSPLPAQNATGNWVKVVQRLPVRIAFDHPPPSVCGAAGLSAAVTVDVRSGANTAQH
jgi:membrane fusion protein (multidrug efflux system)